MPADHIQAAAQVAYQKGEGCTKVYILNDKEVYGAGIAKQVANIAKTQGLQVLGNDGIDTKAANFRTLATKIKSAGADCVFYGGIAQNKGVQLFTDVHAANPTAKLFGPDGMADPAYYTKASPAVAKMSYLTNPTLDPKLYPPAAQDFFAKFKQKYGNDPAPYAIYGYEAMKVALLGDPERRRQGQRPPGGHRRVLQDQGPRLGPRQVLDRQERRHHALRLRRGPRQGQEAGVRQGPQGAGRLLIT